MLLVKRYGDDWRHQQEADLMARVLEDDAAFRCFSALILHLSSVPFMYFKIFDLSSYS